jgi:hypothetical protein
VFDDGNGGSGGSSSSKTTGSTVTHAATTGSSSTGGNDCASLKAKLDAAVAAAVTCGPALAIVQCNGTQIMNDDCGCPSVLLNETTPDKVTAAKAANAAWIQAGCGPFQCGAACFPAGPGFCQPNADGTTGKCSVALPD